MIYDNICKKNKDNTLTYIVTIPKMCSPVPQGANVYSFAPFRLPLDRCPLCARVGHCGENWSKTPPCKSLGTTDLYM